MCGMAWRARPHPRIFRVGLEYVLGRTWPGLLSRSFAQLFCVCFLVSTRVRSVVHLFSLFLCLFTYSFSVCSLVCSCFRSFVNLVMPCPSHYMCTSIYVRTRFRRNGIFMATATQWRSVEMMHQAQLEMPLYDGIGNVGRLCANLFTVSECICILARVMCVTWLFVCLQAYPCCITVTRYCYFTFFPSIVDNDVNLRHRLVGHDCHFFFLRWQICNSVLLCDVSNTH